MIKGIGIDIIEIKRIENSIQKNRRFMERLFTPNEIDYFKSCNYSINTIAGNFSAKEAVMKALGTGLRYFKWKDIEILRDDLGKPHVILKNNAKLVAENKDIARILVSISHCKDYATAQAVAE